MEKAMGTLGKGWIMSLITGIVTVLVGILIMAAPLFYIMGRPIEIRIAMILILGGMAGLVHARNTRYLDCNYLIWILAAVNFVVGLIIIFHPLDTNITFTTLIGLYFIVDGALSIGIGLGLRKYKFFIWILIRGVISLVLFFLVWFLLAGASIQIMALLFGISFILRGAVIIIMAMLIRDYGKSEMTPAVNAEA
jgi:uncharacterized membrane protein HdeD (DUF308 family)